MQPIHAQFIGVELYFDDLERAKKFYRETLSLVVSDDNLGIMPNSIAVGSFVCLERKRAEFYPSKDKAVLFFVVPNLKSALAAIEPNKVVHSESTWAVLHDPEGHNVLLLERAEAEPK